LTTSMMTPPFNISAKPRFTATVPVAREGEESAMGKVYADGGHEPHWSFATAAKFATKPAV
jgi:hypothetical protein